MEPKPARILDETLRVPDDLAELDRWAVWRSEEGRKIPYRVDGRRASTTNQRDWGELHLARKTLLLGPHTGLAFCFFQEDNLVGLDLDDCLDTNGNPKPIVQSMLARFSDTYCEISPSGTGLKLWSRGTLPSSMNVSLEDGVGLEVYSSGRYFTFTGKRFYDAPLEVADHDADIQRIYNAFRPPTIRAIPRGKIPYGTQHNRLIAIAGALRRHGVCDEAVEQCLQIVNRSQCEKPGRTEAISRIVRSTQKWLQ